MAVSEVPVLNVCNYYNSIQISYNFNLLTDPIAQWLTLDTWKCAKV
jgi:hypothetical protein